MVPRGRVQKLGVFVDMFPPDAHNKHFTVGKVGCITRKAKRTPCPAGSTLPTITHRTAPAVTPIYIPGGPLSAVLPGGDRVMLLTVSVGALWWRLYSNGSWTEWTHLGGDITSGATAVSPSSGRVDVFARATDGTIAHATYATSDGWNTWSTIAAKIVDTPGVSSWGSNRFDLFARFPGGALLYAQSDNAGDTWSAWETVGGCLNSSPSAVSWGSGRIDVSGAVARETICVIAGMKELGTHQKVWAAHSAEPCRRCPGIPITSSLREPPPISEL